jgi:type IV pilus assembly protein PilC
MNFGTFVTSYWWAILAGIVVIAGFYLLLRATRGGRMFLDAFKANSPFTRSVYRKMAAERFVTAMGYLISSNVDVEVSLDLTKDIMGNQYMTGRIEDCRKLMDSGATMYDALHEVGIFPRQFSRMLAIGFKSGEIDSMMNRLSEIYEAEVDASLKRVTGSIEPIFVSILSIVVGIIMVSVMLPLINIMSMIG